MLKEGPISACTLDLLRDRAAIADVILGGVWSLRTWTQNAPRGAVSACTLDLLRDHAAITDVILGASDIYKTFSPPLSSFS